MQVVSNILAIRATANMQYEYIGDAGYLFRKAAYTIHVFYN